MFSKRAELRVRELGGGYGCVGVGAEDVRAKERCEQGALRAPHVSIPSQEDRRRIADEALRYAFSLEHEIYEGGRIWKAPERDWRVIRDAYLVAADAALEAGFSEDGPACSGALQMTRLCRGMVFPNEHTHHCPSCYQRWVCFYTCTACPELDDEDRVAFPLPSGGHAQCDPCEQEEKVA